MNIDSKRYYAVLGVDPSSSEELIRAAFRRRAKELHPDFHSGSAKAFIHLKKAYDTLSDANDRAAYDRLCSPPPVQARADHASPHPLYHSPPLRERPSRPRGMSFFGRYALAFLVMGGLSLGAIEAMIHFSGAPAPTIHAAVPRLTTTRDAPESNTNSSGDSEASTTAKTGFWDASNPTGASKPTPEHAGTAPSTTTEQRPW